MSNTPFIGLSPNQPRIFDVPYVAPALSCSPDITDASDVTTDSSDVSDGGGGVII